MILHRALQIFGALALLACLHLFWQASPWGGEGWSRARLLYAGAGAVSSLALIAIGGLGIAMLRLSKAVERMERRLDR
jgi:uncharacterized membrane protein YcjF (UPF0283 family)